MKYGLLLTSMIAGGVCAALLLDEKQGPKRRKMLKKRANEIWNEASHAWNDYSKELKPQFEKLKPQIGKYSHELAEGAKRVTEGTLHRIEETQHNGWSPSARMLGATASAIAFYGAGRSGVVGTLLRTISLGLLARALVASR